MSGGDAAFFFDDDDETAGMDGASAGLASEPIVRPIDELVAIIAGHLGEVAQAIETSDDWPIRALTEGQVAFLQELDFQAQQLNEMAGILKKIAPHCDPGTSLEIECTLGKLSEIIKKADVGSPS